MSNYRTSPSDLEGMPPGVPHIIGNEAAERFSFYGMKAVLAVFMVSYLHLMDGHGVSVMNEAEATEKVHLFNSAVYFTPVLGALLADLFAGKYLTIVWLSLVYCAGHAALACMGVFGNSPVWLAAGLGLIALGSGGIKPCVSAHVGDQFGARNAHLLTRIFNWFYFSINIGAFISMLLTPWLLEWYGPHWAFGVPGVLMAIATFVFWLGRKRFVHVPAGGMGFVKEMFTGGGLVTILKLLPLYLIVAMFWALFDQTGSTWIFQSMDMDRNFLGFEWLPSQIQSLNSVFVLTFIPLFTYLFYPAGDRIWKLTPLRKIGLGLFIMAGSFALVALIQQWIDGGAKPNIGWQIIAFALLTVAEVMVSIVALEFAYTQAPKTMKSLVMCLYLGSVAVGNLFVAGVNHFIQIPDSATRQFEEAVARQPEGWEKSARNIVLPGYDEEDPADDIVARVKDGVPESYDIPGKEKFEAAAAEIERLFEANGGRFPDDEAGNKALATYQDPWGSPIRFDILNSNRARLMSDGPDRKTGTEWDIGMVIEYKEPAAGGEEESFLDFLHPEKPWLDRRKEELGIAKEAATAGSGSAFTRSAFSGGQTKLHGAEYFRFFTWLMLGTAVVFVPYALLYRQRTYLQE
ncbi:MAG: POT family MFS transporter [Akkermansiaceae bacterium]|nr:POT family MFS transporter [Akkermansiaceae bacterium]MCP5542482.1 POT family MFS transporter [Akkermansiaceae bacterium]MCP5545983.1 POT family MFS transporter [Akkermansiaceae bacterium]